jgi:hypothetical protein
VARSRNEKVAIGFLIVWLVFWTSAILIALYVFGRQVLQGELQVALFLIVWLAAAGFGFLSAARRLTQLIMTGKAPPRPLRNHRWRDGVGPPDPPADSRR